MSNKFLIIGAVVLVVGLVVYLSITDSSTTSINTTSSISDNIRQLGDGEVAEPSGPTVELAPNFTLDKLGGGTISLADYRGVKPVVLDFWASWCPNCRRDMPRLSKMYETYNNEVEVIGVNLRESNSKAQNYISSAGILFPIVMDSAGRVSDNYGIRYTNTHVLIRKDGTVFKIIPGDIKESDIKKLISSS
ncbi:TlpA family protein disulfide reductase [Patescibacteria group bacterium]|nr:TlpA family protein disulfide reductase [Patescibacteria group bacterium]